MNWYTVKVWMECAFSIEANSPEEAEKNVQCELPDDAVVHGYVTRLETPEVPEKSE